MADGHVPLHANKNYDGQLTGQPGAHSRFESELFERFTSELTVTARARPPVTDPRGEMFRILLDSYRLAEPVLAADRAAAVGREYYDDAFFGAFKRDALPIVDQRVADAIGASAAFITGAWEQAGKPAVPTQPEALAAPYRQAGRRSQQLPRRRLRPRVRMQVFLIPIGGDVYEPYFEAPETSRRTPQRRDRLVRSDAPAPARHAARSRSGAASTARVGRARARRADGRAPGAR